MMNTYLIAGKNAAEEEGTWEIEAEDEKINGENVKQRVKPETLREGIHGV